MKSTPPPTLTKDCAFLSTVPSWTARLGAATSAFLALSPLQRQTSFLCTGSETFCSGFFVFPPSLSLLNLPVAISDEQLRVFLLG